MSLRNPLGQARGLGSAKHGLGHWWMQRVSAVALVPLTVWFVASMLAVAGDGHATVAAWIAEPLTAVLLVLTVVATFYHAALGLQVVYEDYIASHLVKVAVDLGTKLVCFALATAAVFAVLKLAFAG
jgi:succinate dehydrogenase / fumarate reductase membrane anchor subunit